jgi:amphi-Trp domain-containing protein
MCVAEPSPWINPAASTVMVERRSRRRIDAPATAPTTHKGALRVDADASPASSCDPGVVRAATRTGREEPRMELIEHATKERLRREVVADRLRRLADELSRHNEVPFSRDGLRYHVAVPDEVDFTLEVEISDTKSEIEIEIEW